jgi:hypothetical protein
VAAWYFIFFCFALRANKTNEGFEIGGLRTSYNAKTARFLLETWLLQSTAKSS